MCNYWTIVNKFLKYVLLMDSFGDIKMRHIIVCVTHMDGWLALPLASSNKWIYVFFNAHSKSSKQQYSPLLCQEFNDLNCFALRVETRTYSNWIALAAWRMMIVTVFIFALVMWSTAKSGRLQSGIGNDDSVSLLTILSCSHYSNDECIHAIAKLGFVKQTNT